MSAPSRRASRTPSMSLDELRAIDTVTVDLVTAARAFGIGATKAHLMARGQYTDADGEVVPFPVEVLTLGRAYRVKTADLRRALGVDTPATPPAAVPPPAAAPAAH